MTRQWLSGGCGIFRRMASVVFHVATESIAPQQRRTNSKATSTITGYYHELETKELSDSTCRSDGVLQQSASFLCVSILFLTCIFMQTCIVPRISETLDPMPAAPNGWRDRQVLAKGTTLASYLQPSNRPLDHPSFLQPQYVSNHQDHD